jgi:hypothetical protein
MSELVNQARGLINAASAAIAASRREPPSTASSLLAGLIVNQAQKQRPHNLLLQSIDLDGDSLDWNHINAAMKVVVRTLG